MVTGQTSQVIIERADTSLRPAVETIMTTLGPASFGGATVLVKPNMVGPSAPELGHTTHPDLVRAVVRSCLDRGAKVLVGDNPGGINRNSRNVGEATGILPASEGCFAAISERVVQKTGEETGKELVVSRAVLEADYVISLPRFKTHSMMMVTGALKNVYGYVAGACKARLHLEAPQPETFAKVVCDIHALRPPDLHIMDALTALEGNGPCHGGRLREVGKLLAANDPLALDSVMAKMMGVDPAVLPVQKEAGERGMGKMKEADIAICGPFEPISDFAMPVTFLARTLDEAALSELRKLYPRGMMRTRTGIKPRWVEEKCVGCGDCALNCPAGALALEPAFHISDQCITCYCCVELCPEGALEVPDVEAFRHY